MAAGSRKDLGFFSVAAGPVVVTAPAILCESAIDALSCALLHPDHRCISTSGARPNPAWLKCLQDWFRHRSDALYAELKHIRNALDRILASTAFASEVQLHARHIELLAATHRLLHAQRARRAAPNAGQLSLF